MKKSQGITCIAILLILAIIAVFATKWKTPKEEKTTTTAEMTAETTKQPVTSAEASSSITSTSRVKSAAETQKTTKRAKVERIVEENRQGLKLGRFYVTGYTAEEGFAEGSETASGVGCRPGICAMNDSERRALGIKYGDSIYVEGLGEFEVRDCTAPWITNTVDIWCYTDAEAYAITGYYEVTLL